jgi:hypothetical protein
LGLVLACVGCFGEPGGGLPRDRPFEASNEVEADSAVEALSPTPGADSDTADPADEPTTASSSEMPTNGALSLGASEEAGSGQTPADDGTANAPGSDSSPEAAGMGEATDDEAMVPGQDASGEAAPGEPLNPPGEPTPPAPAMPGPPPPVVPAAGNLPAAIPRSALVGCPPGASYCTSFEDSNLLAGADYISQAGAFVPGESMLVDTVERFSGAVSLRVPATGGQGFDYRMLSVPAPAPDFWIRLHLRTDVRFGDADGDAPLLASVLTTDFNDDRAVQLSEQFEQVVLNKNAQLHGATAPNPTNEDDGVQLEADTWYCVEMFFGGTSGDMFAFVGGVPIISAPAWQPDDYQSFRFGYLRFNTDRNWWFDDVAVATDRIGCP